MNSNSLKALKVLQKNLTNFRKKFCEFPKIVFKRTLIFTSLFIVVDISILHLNSSTYIVLKKVDLLMFQREIKGQKIKFKYYLFKN